MHASKLILQVITVIILGNQPSPLMGQFWYDEAVPEGELLEHVKATYPLIREISIGPWSHDPAKILPPIKTRQPESYGVYYRVVLGMTEASQTIALEKLGTYGEECCLHLLEAIEEIQLNKDVMHGSGRDYPSPIIDSLEWSDSVTVMFIVEGVPYPLKVTDFIPIDRFDGPKNWPKR